MRKKKIQISDFWKNTYACSIGTIVGIILTFGTSAVIQRCEKEESGRKAARMIIHNIDDFCNGLEYDLNKWYEIDSINNIVFNIPYNKVNEIPDSTIEKWFNNLLIRNYRIIDNTAGNIFSNNIDIWKNIDDSRFIENSGQCFGAMQLINDLLDEKVSLQKSLNEYYYETLVYSSEADDNLHEHFYRVVSDPKVKLYLFKFHNFLPGIESFLEDLKMHNRLNKQFMNITDNELKAMDFDFDYQ